MNQKTTLLKYWCVQDNKDSKQLLIIGDSELYDQRHQIEERLAESCAVTTLSVSADANPDIFARFTEIFTAQSDFSCDAIYFRPEVSWQNPTANEYYRRLLLQLMAIHPHALWILGLYGSEPADSRVEAIAKELEFPCAAPDSLKALLAAAPRRAASIPIAEDQEAIYWARHEIRSSQAERPRVLLIGDSIIWGGHEATVDALSEYADVTTFVSSLGVNSSKLSDLVSTLCSVDNSDYNAVYFNNGLHSHGQSAEEYAGNLKTTLSILMKRFPRAVWILGFSTPVSDNPKSGAQHDTPITEKKQIENAEKNALAVQYNEQVQRIAAELSLPCFDAYTLLADKDEWKIDSYHYNEQGRSLFGRAVAQKILAETDLQITSTQNNQK